MVLQGGDFNTSNNNNRAISHEIIQPKIVMFISKFYRWRQDIAYRVYICICMSALICG